MECSLDVYVFRRVLLARGCFPHRCVHGKAYLVSQRLAGTATEMYVLYSDLRGGSYTPLPQHLRDVWGEGQSVITNYFDEGRLYLAPGLR